MLSHMWEIGEVTVWSPPNSLPQQRAWESSLATPPLWPHPHVGFHLLQGNVEVFVINYREKKRGWWRGGDRNFMTQEGSVRNCFFLRSCDTHSPAPDTCLLWLRRSTCPPQTTVQRRKALAPGRKAHPLGNPESPVWKKVPLLSASQISNHFLSWVWDLGSSSRGHIAGQKL